MEQEGYELSLPEGTDPSKDSKKKIMEKIEEEYDPSEYEEVKEKLLEAYSKIDEKFKAYIENTFSNKKDKIKVHLTKYGPGGSYHPPNEVTVCFKGFNTDQVLSNLLHEVIHLYIHPYIEKHDINHWEKERIVDLLLHETNVLERSSWQKNYNEAEGKVDPLFHKHFHESKDKFFKKLKKLG